MPTKYTFPTIVPSLTSHQGSLTHTHYQEIIRRLLYQLLPKHFFSSGSFDKDILEDQKEQLRDLLPLVACLRCTESKNTLSFYMISKLRLGCARFFIELLTGWLVPGKRLNVALHFAADFKLPELSEDFYTVCEVVIAVENEAEMEIIQKNYPIIETEARLGANSSYFARRILEIKGLTNDAKTTYIQECIANLASRLPKNFDSDVFTEMQHVLVTCKDEFKSAREARHLSKIIAYHYLFRKWLLEAVKNEPEKRHLAIKLFTARIKDQDKEKTVLGVNVAVNFLQDIEIFQEKHLLKAIQNYIPSAEAVSGSFFANCRGSENLCTLYLEVAKKGEISFTPQEIETLRKALFLDLKDRIEHLMHPLFMPRNDEEILRNILTLSHQIKYLRDPPQVFISFDQQTQSHLFFTLILVRILKNESKSIQELFNTSNSFLEYIHDFCRQSGKLRKKYTKEATVFRVKLPNDKYLRRDHSIDLYKARQAVVLELRHLIGDFRDFNGGMITKQHEVICVVRDLLTGKEPDRLNYNDLLLENFFYSITPVVMRTVVDPEALKTLFVMLSNAIEIGIFKDEAFSIKIETTKDHVFAMITSKDTSIREDLNKAFATLQLSANSLANCYVKAYDAVYIGYIYNTDNPHSQALFCQAMRNATNSWAVKKKLLNPSELIPAIPS